MKFPMKIRGPCQGPDLRIFTTYDANLGYSKKSTTLEINAVSQENFIDSSTCLGQYMHQVSMKYFIRKFPKS